MNVGTNAKAGEGEHVVAEADESDGSFLQYHPWLGVVLNIEADHLENYEGISIVSRQHMYNSSARSRQTVRPWFARTITTFRRFCLT